ncbi:dockerin type I domain-containing protein [Paenibacillus oleatilyticus]|uniref:Dockerin type I domain-containing protein n=1 Tax=Paenibacillus oleatilyticus TaxID=2594886 RepID=A0ABV4VB80_9BACL
MYSDAVIVGSSLNKSTPEALAAVDINGDGAVNQADLDLIEKNFLAQIAN